MYCSMFCRFFVVVDYSISVTVFSDIETSNQFVEQISKVETKSDVVLNIRGKCLSRTGGLCKRKTGLIIT